MQRARACPHQHPLQEQKDTCHFHSCRKPMAQKVTKSVSSPWGMSQLVAAERSLLDFPLPLSPVPGSLDETPRLSEPPLRICEMGH